MTQKVESKESAELLLTVLKAHGSDVDAALNSVKDHFNGTYTVSRITEDHINLLTDANGYTVRSYRGNVRCKKSIEENPPPWAASRG